MVCGDARALVAFLSRLSGGSCVLPFDRLTDLIGTALPEDANSDAWWTDGAGWPIYPGARACLSAGWRLASVRASARLVRLVPAHSAEAGPATLPSDLETALQERERVRTNATIPVTRN